MPLPAASHICHMVKNRAVDARGRKVMECNVGTVDRVVRIVVGLVLISLVFWGPETNWGWIGLIPLVTGIVGWCPAYRLVGIDTCRREAG